MLEAMGPRDEETGRILTPFQARCMALLNESMDLTRSLLDRETARHELTRLLWTGKLDAPAEPEPFDGKQAQAGERS